MSDLHAVTDAEAVRGTSDDDPSGALAAQAAYDAGAVTPGERVDTFDVVIHCVVVGKRSSAEYVGAVLEQHAERMRHVTEYRLSVAERT